MDDSAALPPPPPLGGDLPAGTPEVDPELEAWEREIEQALDSMATAVRAAIDEHDAGTIDLAEFQQRCLSAGTARVGDNLIIWDWVNGKVFAYDGFQLIELTDIEQ